jgi:hypothetical protein
MLGEDDEIDILSVICRQKHRQRHTRKGIDITITK